MAKGKLPVASKKPIPVKIVSEPSCKPDIDDKWRVQDALRTIKEAERFKADKSLMKGVKALAREEVKALGKIK